MTTDVYKIHLSLTIMCSVQGCTVCIVHVRSLTRCAFQYLPCVCTRTYMWCYRNAVAQAAGNSSRLFPKLCLAIPPHRLRVGTA